VTHLRKMMLEELQRRHYSEATTQRYIRFIERFAQHFQCSPDRLGPQHIREYQAQLFTVRKRWKDADSDIPILMQAKAEYAKLN
jgi:integrase/recombinase XerD